MVITVNTQNHIFLIYMVPRTACQFYFSRSVFSPAPHLVVLTFGNLLNKVWQVWVPDQCVLFVNEFWVGILCCALFVSFLKAGRSNAIADNSLFYKASKHICVCIDLVLCCIHNGETCLQKFLCCWVLQMLQVNCIFFCIFRGWGVKPSFWWLVTFLFIQGL